MFWLSVVVAVAVRTLVPVAVVAEPSNAATLQLPRVPQFQLKLEQVDEVLNGLRASTQETVSSQGLEHLQFLVVDAEHLGIGKTQTELEIPILQL
jgi:hypothetical protein